MESIEDLRRHKIHRRKKVPLCDFHGTCLNIEGFE